MCHLPQPREGALPLNGTVTQSRPAAVAAEKISTGVHTCLPAESVFWLIVKVHGLGNSGVKSGILPCAGHIQDILKAAAGLPNLEVLDLAGQAFSGTLPTQYPFPNLLDLNLMDNNIMVCSHSSMFHSSHVLKPQSAAM